MNRTTPALIGVGVVAALAFLLLGTSYASKNLTPESQSSGEGDGTTPPKPGQSGDATGNAGNGEAASGDTGEPA